MLEVLRHDRAATFLQRAEPALLEVEDRENLILGLAYGLAGATRDETDVFYATIEEDGTVVGCALRTPPHKLLLTAFPPSAAEALVDRLDEAYDEIPAVLGPSPTAEAVASVWAARTGGSWVPGMEQRIYRLDRVDPPRPIAGAPRTASADDLEVAVLWGDGFGRDTGLAMTSTRETVARWIEREQLFVWDDDGPRSIAVAHGRTPNGVRIGYVYTPPEHRGSGYASACVAALSQRMLDLGVRFCVLYTDLSNPTSNGIYARIGYRPIMDVRDVLVFADGTA